MSAAPPEKLMSVRCRRTRRLWRLLFVGYAIALTIGTHWPSLNLGTEEFPAADKFIHLYAFALLAGLLWLTRWVRSILLILVLAIAWVALDEWTQSIAILDRQFSALDAIAGGLGIAIACAWIAALRPLGGRANRSRIGLQHRVMETLFGDAGFARSSVAWALCAALIIPTGLGLLLLLPRVIVALPNTVPAMLFAAGQAAWIGILILLFDRLWRKSMHEAIAARMCPMCGNSDPSRSFDERGSTDCTRCGASLHRGMWLPTLSPEWRTMQRFMQAPAAVAIGIVGIGVGLFFIGVALYARTIHKPEISRTTIRAARGLHDLPQDFVLAVDLSLLLFAFAAMVWMYRRRLARWHDRQHEYCRHCGYDLRATPLVQGMGACPECGMPFGRF